MLAQVVANCGQAPAAATADSGYFSRENVEACAAAGVDAYIAVGRDRQCIVEPAFGQIKQARGLRRFSFRGLEKVRAEWSFVCATHNQLKLFRRRFRPLQATAQA